MPSLSDQSAIKISNEIMMVYSIVSIFFNASIQAKGRVGKGKRSSGHEDSLRGIILFGVANCAKWSSGRLFYGCSSGRLDERRSKE